MNDHNSDTNTSPIVENNINSTQPVVIGTPDYPKRRNISWDKNIEKNILSIGEKAHGYRLMHIQESRNMSHIYEQLMYSGILLGPLAALLSGIQTIIAPDDSDVYLPIAVTCIGFISGIVVAITKYGKFEEKSSSHKLAASKYTSLESNVRRQLILSRNNRVNAEEYLEYIGKSFDELFTSSPLVANKTYENYVQIAKENGLTIPDEYKITINSNEKLYKSVSAIDSKENANLRDVTDHTEDGFISEKSTTPRRINTISHFSDVNKFSDGRIVYEMNRMMASQNGSK